MTDCYRILGVSWQASPREIRAAYLARMKLCHPDAAQGGAEEASEISRAYWQLRDAHRRAEHDHLLFAPVPRAELTHRKRFPARVSLPKRPPPPGAAGAARPAGKRAARRRSRSRRLEPLRAAAGMAACALAIAGFAAAGTHLGAPSPPQAHAAASLGVASMAERLPRPARRKIDPDLAAAAASEFRQVLARSGLAGAHLYARQCLIELSARPTGALLDHCIAFDDAASSWEGAAQQSGRVIRRYFAAAQRGGRYASAARNVAAGPLRDSVIAEAGYFAGADD